MYDVCAPAPVLCGRALRLSAFDIALLQAILANRLKADFYKRSQCAPDAHCQPAGDRLKSQHVSGSAFGHLGRSGPAPSLLASGLFFTRAWELYQNRTHANGFACPSYRTVS